MDLRWQSLCMISDLRHEGCPLRLEHLRHSHCAAHSAPGTQRRVRHPHTPHRRSETGILKRQTDEQSRTAADRTQAPPVYLTKQSTKVTTTPQNNKAPANMSSHSPGKASHTLTSPQGTSRCTVPALQLYCILPRPWVHLASKHQRHTVPRCLFCTLPRPKARLTSHNLGTQIGGKQASWRIAQAQGPFGK